MRHCVPIEIKEIDSRTGAFAGWGSIFDVKDDGGDTVRKGAFEKSLRLRKPKIYLMHESSVGVLDVAVEKPKGLWVEGQPDESRGGLDARENLKSGALDSMSIGYATVTAKETARFERDLLEVKLFHVGLVPFGMNEEAVVTAVKALDLNAVTTIRELEHALRDAGLSRKHAETLCAPGYIAKLSQGDPDESVAELVKAIKAGTTTLREVCHGSSGDQSRSG